MIIALIIVFLYLINPKYVSSIGEFTLKQNIIYSIDNNGNAKIKHDISLTNNFSQIYAKEYQINLPGINISKIISNDQNGNIIDRIEKDNDYTKVFLNFNNPVIGKDKTNQFSLEYFITDFAFKKGNTREIQLPNYTTNSDNESISIILDIPTNFGELSFSSIPIKDTHTLGKINQIRLNNKQISNKKILMVFGNNQLFDFQLNYYLENFQNKDVYTEIPIPPDTNSQTIVLKKIEPPPTDIRVDSDGNWLAKYYLVANQSININVSGQAKIHPPIYTPKNIDTVSLITPQKYWPSDNQKIIDTAQSLKTAKDIYRFVVNKLNYNYSGIEKATRRGALYAIDNPDQSVCTEFTDLFVTLARAIQIPSREIEGFAYSNSPKIKPISTNSDILHAWPEYYDNAKKDWVQIDPTWEKTTNGIDYFTDIDLNHLAFVIHGVSSDNPAPPGSYKRDQQSKTVNVDFATSEYKPDYVSPTMSIIGNQIILTNPNPFSIHLISLNIDNLNQKYQINSLPPFGKHVIATPRISFVNSLLPQNSKYKITLTTGESDNTQKYYLINKSHYLNLSIIIGISITILSIGGIIITVQSRKYEKNS